MYTVKSGYFLLSLRSGVGVEMGVCTKRTGCHMMTDELWHFEDLINGYKFRVH